MAFGYNTPYGYYQPPMMDNLAQMRAQLEDMLKDAGGESEHMAIKKAISVLKNA